MKAPAPTGPVDVIVIGASAGGVAATKALVKELPAAVMIVLHTAPTGGYLASILDWLSPLEAAFARDGERIQRGRIYVAPPDRSMALSTTSAGSATGSARRHSCTSQSNVRADCLETSLRAIREEQALLERLVARGRERSIDERSLERRLWQVRRLGWLGDQIEALIRGSAKVG